MAGLLSLGLIMTFASHAIPWWLLNIIAFHAPIPVISFIKSFGPGNLLDVLCLAFALLLALPAYRRNGLTLGSRPESWVHVIVIVCVPVVLAALVYPLLPVRPFSHQSISMWLISPLAQDIVFMGYLYGLFARRASEQWHRTIPMNTALLLSAVFFMLWHLPNFESMPAGFVLFQMVYVFIGAMWTGMTRVRTGTILYVTLAHMGVNYIAWQFS